MQVDVQQYLRQRPPFLFVHQAVIGGDAKEIETETVFDESESFFKGHFPDAPVVPGVILLEVMAQSARLLMNFRAGQVQAGYLVAAESLKLSAIIRPNVRIRTRTQLLDSVGVVTNFKSASFIVDSGKRCARGQLALHVEATRATNL